MRFLISMILGTYLFSATSLQAGHTQSEGVYLGLTLARSTGNFVAAPEYKPGLSGGIYFNFPITGPLSWQAEISYAMKGYQIHHDDQDITATFTYIDFPILLKSRLLDTKYFRAAWLAGPALSMTIKNEQVTKSGSETTHTQFPSFHDYDIGLTAGLGCTLLAASQEFSLDLRHTWGLTDWLGEDDIFKNRVISILFGFSF